MGKRKSDYIFAPERQRGGGLGCFAILCAVVLAVGLLAILVNHATNERVDLLSQKVSVMSLDKAFEGFT
ncbi:MAG: hypothetical protein RSA65_00130, partial [Clostridia bacterium]